MIYKTKENDVLDGILWQIFGFCNEALLQDTYSLNPGLCNYGAILPAGLSVVVPAEVQSQATDQDKGVKLWD